jgi:poly(hydroxyalkanoate) depolymerase family esterase
MRQNTYKRAWERALRVAAVLVVGAAVAVPATAASAATLPGLPAWASTTHWWSKLTSELTQAGWKLPYGGGVLQPPAPSQPPGGGTGSVPPSGGSGSVPPSGGTGTAATFSGNFTSSNGTRAYKGYVPSSYKQGTAVPLVVVLHGCTQDADVMRQLTRFDQLAESKGFIVVFPEQPQSANQTKCWNFFQDAQLHRGSGEPALIAGITGWVQQHYTIDPKRVYVAGLSAGGAMASVMGATYPDLYAAIGVGSGCEYAAGAACAGYQSADPSQAGKAAFSAMGASARPMPVIAFQGDKDTTVPPVNATQLIQQWQLTDDMADDDAANGSIAAAAVSSEDGQVPNGRSYTVQRFNDGAGKELIEYWLVHGMSHAWSGGCSCEQYSDPQGPDETAAMYDFFARHPMQ